MHLQKFPSMSIDLNKPNEGGGSSSGSRLNYADPNSSNEVREVYRFAYECKQKGLPDYQLEQTLMNRGLDPGDANLVTRNVSQTFASRNQGGGQSDQGGGGGGTKIPSIVFYIGILILINVLSAVFNWGFWLY